MISWEAGTSLRRWLMMFVPRLPDTGKTPILDILWFSVELEMCIRVVWN